MSKRKSGELNVSRKKMKGTPKKDSFYPRSMSVPRELRGVDIPISLTIGNVLATTSTNGGVQLLNGIQQGSASFNRIGRKVLLKSLRMKIIWTLSQFANGTTGDYNGNLLRIVVVWDKQPSGVQPTYDTIFGRTNDAGTESAQVFDSLRFDNTGRFKVLSDKVYECNPKAGLVANGDFCNYRYFCDEYIKLKNLETVYSGSTNPASIADISTGGLYVYFRALQNDANDDQFIIDPTSFARLRYYD